jgi:hypothetical protein
MHVNEVTNMADLDNANVPEEQNDETIFDGPEDDATTGIHAVEEDDEPVRAEPGTNEPPMSAEGDDSE